tara:strand:+ start:1751 stop:3112 length:1362 start_codon:yes stop_codon:yes gene_type:complete
MPQRTLSEWLDIIEVTHPIEIEFGLERISQVANRLGFSSSELRTNKKYQSNKNSQKNLTKELSPANKIIIVGGTNGKGSCVAILDSILRKNGYKVGTYTSPHLIQFNERITINGKHASDLDICLAFEEINLARSSISLSYFEFSTLAALMIMANSDLDFAILEVGLGGRLDAVNCIDSDLSIITGIALDHQQWLGDNLDLIGAEKASIGRINAPMIYGDTRPVSSVIATAKDLKVDLLLNGIDFNFEQFGITDMTSLPSASVTCAIKAAKILDPNISKKILSEGLNHTKIDGRFQKISLNGVNIILDVAHNPQASEMLAKRLLAFKSENRIIAITGIMSDKDILGILKPFIELVDLWNFCDIPNNKRACSAKEVASVVQKNYVKKKFKETCTASNPLSDNIYSDQQQYKFLEHSKPEDAIKKAIQSGSSGDTIIVFGSFLIVGPVLNWLNSLH